MKAIGKIAFVRIVIVKILKNLSRLIRYINWIFFKERVREQGRVRGKKNFF